MGKSAALCGASALVMAALLRHNALVGQAVGEALALCARSVIPALLPFFITVSLAIGCGLFDLLRRMGLPPEAAVFVVGAIGGYPVGARTAGELFRQGGISRRRAQRLLTCCNNAGPSFILSIVGTGVFGDKRMGLVLYIIHLLAALAAGWLMGRIGAKKAPVNGEKCTGKGEKTTQKSTSFSVLLVESVRSGAASMVSICGFVVYFWVLAALLRQLFPALSPALGGLLELTGGITALPPTARGFCAAAALLGWGGVSVHCQTAAVLEGSGLAPGGYLPAKAVQAVISAAMAAAVCPLLF